MGRESMNDPIVIQSSIALLQERFRQLQRMKEMREERELLKKLAAEPKQCSNPSPDHDQSSGLLFFHFLPPRSPPSRQVPNNFSIWSGSQGKGASTTFRCMDAPLFASLLPTVIEKPSSLHVSLNKFEDSDYSDDVDTSLHL
ncbi:hypothetical protein REPUB_Repub13aG0279000 [Reevesia pubescens]